ncbi:MAG: class II aldolase/adducin family protein [Candidatus Diapherotrites archaeon]|nr:class II aldolase/adducin family protein [Candidatus Diapherotrites archaeon]
MLEKTNRNFRCQLAQDEKEEKQLKKDFTEGVVKFSYSLNAAKMPLGRISNLVFWRDKLFDIGLIGVYNKGLMKGIAYGNISMRANFRGKRGFFITGSQTGSIKKLAPDKYCFIESFNINKNFVKALGSIAPSSESLTHGAIYSTNPRIGAVVHIHNKEIFEKADKLSLDHISERATYGSVDLAIEIKKAIKRIGYPEIGTIVTLGHKDGIFVWHKSIEEASTLCIDLLKRAKSL